MSKQRKAPGEGGLTQFQMQRLTGNADVPYIKCHATDHSIIHESPRFSICRLIADFCVVIASVRCTVSRLARLCQTIKKAANLFIKTGQQSQPPSAWTCIPEHRDVQWNAEYLPLTMQGKGGNYV